MAIIRYKSLAHEIDGVEQAYPSEIALDANNIYFENSGTNYASDNVQDAIQEGVNTAIELPRFPLQSVHNGTMSDGQLVGVSNLVNNPIVVPIKSELAEITFYQSSGATKDSQFRLYKGDELPGNLFFTWTLLNTTTAVVEGFGTDFTSPTFNPGDLLRVYFDSVGSNPNDVTIFYFFQAVE